MNITKKLFGKKRENQESYEESQKKTDNQQPQIDTTPDTPQPFGYKNGWLAIKNETPQSVIEKLQLKNAAVANWQSGLKIAYDNNQIFVTPILEGYVLVIGLLDLSLEQLEEIAQKFEEVQYFLTHRIVDVHSWTKFQKGNLIRHYYYLGESGEVESKGGLTKEELELGLENLCVSEEEDWENAVFPEEENVLEVAAAWSVDTSMKNHKEETSTGFLCTGM